MNRRERRAHHAQNRSHFLTFEGKPLEGQLNREQVESSLRTLEARGVIRCLGEDPQDAQGHQWETIRTPTEDDWRAIGAVLHAQGLCNCDEDGGSHQESSPSLLN
jgi:hypothetical protein